MGAAVNGTDDRLRVPSSYPDQIAQILQREILEGRYGRGEHLQQDEISVASPSNSARTW